MRIALLVLFIGFGCQSAMADVAPDDAKTAEALKANVIDFRDWFMKELSQFPKAGSSTGMLVGRRLSFNPKRNQCFTANQYNQAAKSDWVKCQIMQGLSLLSTQLANTAGTAFAPQSVSQLQQYSTQLQQSDDPQFQQVGSLYGQEAQAMQTGDIQGADLEANQVSAIPAPMVAPGYQPSQGEDAMVEAFNQVIGTVLASLGGVLGTLVVSQLLQALGITSLGSLLGTGAATGSSIASGQNPGVAANNAGANVVQASGGAVLQQLGTINVKPLAPQDSVNTGGAPSAQ
jgi:hypothetical protein